MNRVRSAESEGSFETLPGDVLDSCQERILPGPLEARRPKRELVALAAARFRQHHHAAPRQKVIPSQLAPVERIGLEVGALVDDL